MQDSIICFYLFETKTRAQQTGTLAVLCTCGKTKWRQISRVEKKPHPCTGSIHLNRTAKIRQSAPAAVSHDYMTRVISYHSRITHVPGEERRTEIVVERLTFLRPGLHDGHVLHGIIVRHDADNDPEKTRWRRTIIITLHATRPTGRRLLTARKRTFRCDKAVVTTGRKRNRRTVYLKFKFWTVRRDRNERTGRAKETRAAPACDAGTAVRAGRPLYSPRCVTGALIQRTRRRHWNISEKEGPCARVNKSPSVPK